MIPLIILGPIFTFLSILTLLFPPKKINSVYGYRTSKSMSSQKAWDTAQKISSRIMLIEGLIFMAICGIIYPFQLSEEIGIMLGLSCLIIGLIFLFVTTERKIKNL
jgi:uncharacterized membrane protein